MASMEATTATAGPEVSMEASEVQQPQGVVLVILDVNKEISTHALNWALGHVARKGDALRLVGILTHVLNPMGYKCRVDENSWTGANKRILENELANKRYMLQNIQDLDNWCEKAGVQLVIQVRAGLNPKQIAVEEAKTSGAYHVVLDRTMKKDRKYFIDNLTCFVTRVRNSGGVDSVRSFAISKPLPPNVPNTPRTTNTQISTSPFSSVSSNFSTFTASNLLSKTPSLTSLRGSSVSSATFNQDSLLSKQNSMTTSTNSLSSSSFEIRSHDDLFSIDHDETASHQNYSGPLPSEPSTTDSEAAYLILPPRKPTSTMQWLAKDSSLSANKIHNDFPHASKALATQTCTIKASPLITRSTSDKLASGRLGNRQSTAKSVWIWTRSKEVMAASVEGGWTTFIFTPETKDLAVEWTSQSRIKPLFLEGGQFWDSENKQVAVLGQVASAEQLHCLPSLMGRAEVVVMNAIDWQVIPAESMVAAFQDSSTALFATANTACDAQVYLEALEKGTDGIVLQTEDPAEVFALKAYLKGRRESANGVRLVKAMVTQVEPVGMGDRVCVDLCNLLNPGEGLLVGSFERALFLVHSEYLENDDAASRPFRVNAGPVHAYVGMAGGSTTYLSELHTGSQVMVVDAQGRSRTVLVGRVKIESRPLLLVEVEVEGHRHSVLLQNAETVCLVTPGDNNMRGNAVAVTSLKLGDSLLLSLQNETNLTGVEKQEYMVEK